MSAPVVRQPVKVENKIGAGVVAFTVTLADSSIVNLQITSKDLYAFYDASRTVEITEHVRLAVERLEKVVSESARFARGN